MSQNAGKTLYRVVIRDGLVVTPYYTHAYSARFAEKKVCKHASKKLKPIRSAESVTEESKNISLVRSLQNYVP